MFSFKTRYHYVPPCPRCGSKKTGRFLFMMNTYNGIENAIADCLSKGELVQIRTNIDPQYENAYCEECGCEWHAEIDTILLSSEQICEQAKQRGITANKINNIKNIKKNTKKTIKEKRKKAKEEKKRQKQEKKLKKKQNKKKIL